MVQLTSQKPLKINTRERATGDKARHGQLIEYPESVLDIEVFKSKKAKKLAQGNGNAKAASDIGNNIFPVPKCTTNILFYSKLPTRSFKRNPVPIST